MEPAGCRGEGVMAGTLQSTEILVSWEELTDIGLSALERLDVPTADARRTVDVLLYADLRGVGSHGIQRLLMYVPRLRKQLIKTRPDIRIERLSPVMSLV